MKLKNLEGWQQSLAANEPPDPWIGLDDPSQWSELTDTDDLGKGYGWCVMWYCQHLAEAAEQRIEAGEPIGDWMEELGHEIDRGMGRYGLTGFQYGMAISLLSQVWQYGEELRRWHNLKEQIGDEGERANVSGGVLNPALLNIK